MTSLLTCVSTFKHEKRVQSFVLEPIPRNWRKTFQETDFSEFLRFKKLRINSSSWLNVFLYHAFCFLPKSWELIDAIWPGTYCGRECVPFARKTIRDKSMRTHATENMHRRAVLAVDALQSNMQACQDEKEFLALLLTYENIYWHMNDTSSF